MDKLGAMKKLGAIGSTKAEHVPVFEPDRDERWESAIELTPEILFSLEEKYGDQPEWMKISGYREGRHAVGHRKRAELLLNLSGHDYWFPLSPKVYENFVGKIVNEDRGQGLRYLQRYIRQYREYKDRWPSKRYVKRNRMDRDSFMGEGIDPSQVGLSQEVIDFILDAHQDGRWSIADIAKEASITRAHVESVLALAGMQDHPIADADVATTADKHKSLKAMRVMAQGRERQRSIRLTGMKPRSPKVRFTPNSF